MLRTLLSTTYHKRSPVHFLLILMVTLTVDTRPISAGSASSQQDDTLELAHELYRRKDYANAADEYQKYLRQGGNQPTNDGKRVEATFYLAESLVKTNKIEPAFKMFESVLDLTSSTSIPATATQNIDLRRASLLRCGELAVKQRMPRQVSF